MSGNIFEISEPLPAPGGVLPPYFITLYALLSEPYTVVVLNARRICAVFDNLVEPDIQVAVTFPEIKDPLGIVNPNVRVANIIGFVSAHCIKMSNSYTLCESQSTFAR